MQFPRGIPRPISRRPKRRFTGTIPPLNRGKVIPPYKPGFPPPRPGYGDFGDK